MKYFTRQFVKKNLGIISIIGILLGGLALLWVVKNNTLLFNSRATGGTSLSIIVPSTINKAPGQKVELTVALNPNGKKITEADIKVVADTGLTIQSITSTSSTLTRILAPGVVATDGQSATLSIAGENAASLEANENIATVVIVIGSELTGTKIISIDATGTQVYAVGFPGSVLDGTTAASISFTTRIAQTPLGTPVVGGKEELAAAKLMCESNGGHVVSVGVNETTSVPTGYQCVDKVSGTSCEIIAFYQGSCVFPTAGVTQTTTATPTISPAPTDSVVIRQTPLGTPIVGGEEELNAAKLMCENNGGRVVATGVNEVTHVPTGYQCVDKLSGTSCEIIAFYHGTCLFPTSSVTRIPTVTVTATPTVSGQIIVETLAPSVTTGNISNITSTSFSITGRVTASNGSPITECGFLYSKTSSTPTIGTASKKTAICARDGAFVNGVTGLAANTQYYVRAYSINNGYTKTGYGNVVTVKTTTNGSTTPVPTMTGTIAPTNSSGMPVSDPNATIMGTPQVTTSLPVVTTTKVAKPSITALPTQSSASKSTSDFTYTLITIVVLVLMGIGIALLVFVMRK